MKNLVKGTLAACALLLPQLASAAIVTQWEYEVFSEWTSATYEATGTGTQTLTPTEISWGGTAAYTNQAAGIGTARSALIISNAFATGTNLFTGSLIPALTNIITHWNNTLQGGTKSLINGVLKTSLKLKPYAPVEAPAFFPAKVLNFTIKFTETPNGGTCFAGSVSQCDDIFTITVGNLENSFNYDGVKYTTNIIETTASLTGLSPAACAAAGAPAGCLGFKTEEKKATAAQFGLLINGIEVSEPAGIAVLGLGLMGFVMLGRRRANKTAA